MGKKIAIAIPTNRGFKPKCLDSILKMLAHTKEECVPIVATEGFNTAENRTWLVAQASKQDCTHIFFLDDDMVYEPGTLDVLLKHDKDVIGATYANRRGDGVVTGFREDVKESKSKPFKVVALGGGCMLVNMKVFEKIGKPWFWYDVAKEGFVVMSNDWWFCGRAYDANIDVWVEPKIHPKHIGKKEYA